jgi:hypothetical protein
VLYKPSEFHQFSENVFRIRGLLPPDSNSQLAPRRDSMADVVQKINQATAPDAPKVRSIQ